MPSSILVVTPDSAFGALIRQSLEETRRFGVRVTGDPKTAVEFVYETVASLVFLDASLGEELSIELGYALRQANPEIKFVIVSDAWTPVALDDLEPEELLSKPFYLPDLLDMMERLFPDSMGESAGPDELAAPPIDEPTWLLDVNRAAQHLTRLTLESSAQAALIIREGGLWAYAGQLPQTAANELAEVVNRYWNKHDQSDLVRFIRLSNTHAEHMVYATRLATNMVLTLVFDAETPFSTIRSQASQLAHSLAEPAGQEILEDEYELDAAASINNILSDVPPPNVFRNGNNIEMTFSRETSPAIPLETSAFSLEASPAPQFQPVAYDESKAIALETDLEQTRPSPAVTRKSLPQRKQFDGFDPHAETRPHIVAEEGQKIVLEPVSPSVYSLNYACLLIPRFTHHHLTGDLATSISEWVLHTCISYGWRLEHIAVRPDYLQWIVNIPPATSPGYLMRIVRQRLSERLFEDFPRFKKENPSGDFWAPGYLIMGGSQPPPAQLIREYIQQTRQRQGIA